MASPNASTLSSSIVATLKGRIIAWRYPPEHRLTEDGLCREFRVSRSPVREALRVLATNGFISRMDNRGYAVRQVRLAELEELYDVRLALELFAIETLATLNTASDALAELAELAKVWRGVRRRPRRMVEELAKLDAQFHERLASLIKNDTLLQQLKSIDERLFVFRMIDFEAADRVKNTCIQHLAILDRIAEGDAAGAREAMRRNITDGRNIVGKSIKEALARAYGQ